MQQKNTPLKLIIASSLVMLSAGLYGCSSNSSDPAPTDETNNQQAGTTGIGRTEASAIGDVFAFGAANRTLYTFANDIDNVSNCIAACLETWPPVTVASATTEGQFSTIELSDGSHQWTFKNRPVYYFEGDAVGGEVNGEGFSNGAWAVARPDPIQTNTTSLGTVLAARGSISTGTGDPATRTNVNNLTLYTFKNDTANTSVCNGQCAVVWPPLYADAGAMPADGFSLVTRDDNSVQWAQGGQPLYLFQGDVAAGDVNGDGVNGVWDVAVPISQ